jgi:hypothetical protein
MKAMIELGTLIFLLALAIIAVALVIPFGLKMLSGIVNGKCWMDMGTTVDTLKDNLKEGKMSEDSASAEIKKMQIGDCAGGIIIFNKGDTAGSGFSQVIKDRCTDTDTAKAYILVIPWKTLTDEARSDETIVDKFTRWFSHPILSFKEFWGWGSQSLKSIKPICSSVPVKFDGSYCIPAAICSDKASDLSLLIKDKLNTQTREYCYKPIKIANANDKENPYSYKLGDLTECTGKSS